MIVIEELDNDTLQISLDIMIVVDNIELNETIDVENNVQDIIDNITNIITDFGYEELEPGKPSDSKSMYFTFCDKDDYDSEEIELIISMRVSDHNLPKWDDEETNQNAKDRQLNYIKNRTKDYYILNKHLTDKDTIPVEYIYVKYENEWYSDTEEVYDKVRKKLQDFKYKH